MKKYINIKHFIIRLLLFAVFIIAAWLLCIVQALVSMREYSGSPSAGCMTCSLAGEIFRYSLFVPPVPALAYAALRKVKAWCAAPLLTVIHALACLCVNHSIFIARESAWSTYTLFEEISATWDLSCLPVIISSLILFPVIIGIKQIKIKKT